MGLDGAFLRVNSAWKTSLGWSAEAMTHRSFASMVHPDDRTATEHLMRQLVAGSTVRGFVNRVRSATGAYRTLAWHAERVGEQVYASARDVTELRRENESLRALAATAAVGRWEIDHVHAVADASAEARTVMGLNAVETLGSVAAFLQRVAPDDRGYVRRALERITVAGGRTDLEHRVVTSDGQVRWVHSSVTVELGPDGHASRTVGVIQDVTDRARRDSVTGAASSQQLRLELTEAIAASRVSGRLVAVCTLDLDHFADTVATFGRDGSDRVLVALADRLRQVVRPPGLVARTGGDQFTLLLREVSGVDDVHVVLRRVHAAIGVAVPLPGDRRVQPRASIGVALAPSDSDEADTLLRLADHAMQQAKLAGRDQVRFYDTASEHLVRSLLERRRRLRQALAANEFVLHYQPCINLADGALCGFEALLRWQHPERGLLSPGAFLPDLEGDPLEVDVGRWVLAQALEQWEAWRRAGIEVGARASISVNVGAHQLLAPGFVTELGAALARHPALPPETLHLEVLESAALHDVELARDVLGRCRALGVQIALDDFGTGYSSLAYFRSLPIDVLKVDQSFVARMLDNPDDLGIVISVIGLARAFNRGLVVEGVETLEHAAALVHLGADRAQGYGLGRPMPADAVPAWVEAYGRDAPLKTLQRAQRFDQHELFVRVALRSHTLWVDEMRRYRDDPERVPPPPLHPRACAFGAWYAGSGNATYGARPEYAAIGTVHEDLHAAADRLVDAVRDGQTGTAEEAMHALERAHQRLVAGLERLMALT